MKFSVLLPTRNGGPYLRDCVSSVLGQSEADMELVIADNANTDQTPELLREFEENDKRVRVVRHATVKSVTENWNSALEASRGEYLVMIGDDDCLLPGYFDSLRRVLSRFNDPDCIVYNGFSYVFPGSVGHNQESYFVDPHFTFDRSLSEGPLPAEYRRGLVRDMFRFVVRYPLNIQLTMFSRRAMNLVPAPFFRAPFPDHFAINSLLLKAGSIVYTPERLLVIGLSQKSFGHFAYGGADEDGMTYLGSTSSFPGRLDGSELMNSMHAWLLLLKTAYPEELAATEIDRGAYVRRQVMSWVVELRQGHFSQKRFGRRMRELRAGDWGRLATSGFSPDVWRRLPKVMAIARRDRIRQAWPRATALPGVSDIAEFSAWASREHQPQAGRPGTSSE